MCTTSWWRRQLAIQGALFLFVKRKKKFRNDWDKSIITLVLGKYRSSYHPSQLRCSGWYSAIYPSFSGNNSPCASCQKVAVFGHFYFPFSPSAGNLKTVEDYVQFLDDDKIVCSQLVGRSCHWINAAGLHLFFVVNGIQESGSRTVGSVLFWADFRRYVLFSISKVQIVNLLPFSSTSVPYLICGLYR